MKIQTDLQQGLERLYDVKIVGQILRSRYADRKIIDRTVELMFVERYENNMYNSQFMEMRDRYAGRR